MYSTKNERRKKVHEKKQTTVLRSILDVTHTHTKSVRYMISRTAKRQKRSMSLYASCCLPSSRQSPRSRIPDILVEICDKRTKCATRDRDKRTARLTQNAGSNQSVYIIRSVTRMIRTFQSLQKPSQAYPLRLRAWVARYRKCAFQI
jgi:hypothetical protein